MIKHNVSLLRRIAFWALAWYWAVPTRLIAILFTDSALLRWNGTVALTVAMLSLVLSLIKAPLVTRRENTGIKLTLFFIFATSCGLLSGSPVSWFMPLPYMFLLISGVLLRPTADELRILGAAFIVGSFFELLAGMYAATTPSGLTLWGDSLVGLNEQSGRVTGLRVDANTYALQMATTACLLFFAATRQKSSMRKIVIACLGILFVSGLFLSASRGGMLTLAGGVLYLLFFLPGKEKLYRLLQVSFSIGIAVFVISSFMNNWQPFQYAGMKYQKRLLRDSRFYVWEQYFRLPPWEYLWFGIGWKGSAVRHQNGMAAATPYMPEPQIAHNMYLQQLHEGGIVGLGAYLALIFFALKGLRKTSRESPSGSVREVESAMLLLLITQLIGGITLSETERLIFFLIGLSFSTISANRSAAVDPYPMLDRGRRIA